MMMKAGVALLALVQGSVAVGGTNVFRMYPANSWDGAQAKCFADGGVLAPILNRADNEEVAALAKAAGEKNYWLGGGRVSDCAADTCWAWINGQGTSQGGIGDFSLPDSDSDGNTDFWNNDEPNNYLNKEDCIVGIAKTGKWNDAVCSSRRAFVCKFEGKAKTLCVLFVIHKWRWFAFDSTVGSAVLGLRQICE
jgi:hypothetical protein